MENYENKYKRALKKAKKDLKSCGSDSYVAKLIYSFFPELKESERHRWIFDETNRDKVVVTGYCCLFVSSDKMELGPQGPDCLEVNTIKPATKIQRDLLFEKMEKAGYK